MHQFEKDEDSNVSKIHFARKLPSPEAVRTEERGCGYINKKELKLYFLFE